MRPTVLERVSAVVTTLTAGSWLSLFVRCLAAALACGVASLAFWFRRWRLRIVRQFQGVGRVTEATDRLLAEARAKEQDG